MPVEEAVITGINIVVIAFSTHQPHAASLALRGPHASPLVGHGLESAPNGF